MTGRLNEISQQHVWQSAVCFICDVISLMGHTESDQFHVIEARLNRLRRLYEQLTLRPPRAPPVIRALPAVVVDDLYAVFSPHSDRNPFKTEQQRWRNFVIFSFLLHLGLRRSEIAVLAADALKRRDASLDRRARLLAERGSDGILGSPERPRSSLKNKYARRQLPVLKELVILFDIYVKNYRSRAHPPVSIMFCRRDFPLALRTFVDRPQNRKCPSVRDCESRADQSRHDRRLSSRP